MTLRPQQDLIVVLPVDIDKRFAECAEELPGYTWLDRPTIRESYSIPTAFRFYQKTMMDLVL